VGDDEIQDYGEPEYGEPDYDSPEEPSGRSFIKWPRDPQLDPAKADLKNWFESKPSDVFYGRQLEVIFEKKYFHWIIHKALKELTQEANVVVSEIRVTEGGNKLRLYWSKQNRYWKRAAQEVVKLVEEHSSPDLSKALGHTAETLFAVAAGKEGFKIDGSSLNTFGGKKWRATEHDLDWVFSRDGVSWGVEIKNTWAYIDREEMRVKIQLCAYLGLKPLFIMRWAPKSYIEIVRKSGGFCLLFEHQFFPVGNTVAMKRLQELFLPVISPTVVPDGIFTRFVNWHIKASKL
jgi:hypothetical protein